MGIDNVNLWYAKDTEGEIITIDKVDKNTKDKYFCPLCGSEVIPRQGEINSWCFAHIDKSECSSESMYHFWCKNELLKKGDKFIIKSDEEKEYICKQILIEQTYEVNNKSYRPDLTVIAETGETIFFEMEYTNTKRLEDYIDIWIGLGNIVVQVDVKTLINSKSNQISTFKALWYDGKCFNVKKGEDNIYYETIGKYKEENYNKDINEKRKADIEGLDWLWKDIKKYKMGEVNIEHISDLIQNIEDINSRKVVVSVLRKTSCNQIIKDYVIFNRDRALKKLVLLKEEINKDKKHISYIIKRIPHIVYDRIYGDYSDIYYKNECILINFTYKNIKDINKDEVFLKIKKCDEYMEEYERRKVIFNTFKNYKIPSDYSDLCTNLETSGFPKLNYYSSYGGEHRIYLNNFKNARYGEHILIMQCESIEKIENYIIKKLGNSEDVFTKDEIILINNISGKLKEEYKNISISLYDGNRLVVNIFKLNKNKRPIYEKEISSYSITKGEVNIDEIYNSVKDNINDKINSINKFEKTSKYLISYIENNYNHSLLCDNLDSYTFPLLIKDYDSYRNNEELILEHFKNCNYPNNCISIKDYLDKDMIIEYLNNKIKTNFVFSKDEIKSINATIGKLKNSFKNIKIKASLHDGSEVQIEIIYLSKKYKYIMTKDSIINEDKDIISNQFEDIINYFRKITKV